MHIVLIETSGNQNYIFATNKLRENVGASELTYQVGTKYVMEAIGKGSVVKDDLDGIKLRSFLLDEKQNPFTDADGHKVEVIIATSGKALLLVNDEQKARKIITEVTKRSFLEMPGLTVHGAIETVQDDLKDIHRAVGKVHQKLEGLRYRVPSNQQRFLRLPFVEPCATSGLPAEQIYRHESVKGIPEELKPYSSLSILKQEASNAGRDRLEALIKSVLPVVDLPGNISELEDTFKQTRWIAIVHADGNGLGELFLKFANHLQNPPNTTTNLFDNIQFAREYIETYQKFSLELDACTISAAGKAIEHFQSSYNADQQTKGRRARKIPFIPLILGGDDLTVICDGEYALKFTYDFLTEFEEQVKKNDVIKPIAERAFGVGRLGMCAGVAIIKPHYPFHQAYELAEQLLKSSKQVKTKVRHKVQRDAKEEVVSLPCSAIDFHILYDSSGVELNQIRDKLKVRDHATYLFAKPYIITPMNETPLDPSWLTPRRWDELRRRVCAMLATDEGDETKHALPNSQLHVIRQSLHRGRAEADAVVGLVAHRYEGFKDLLVNKTPPSIFFQENHKIDGVVVEWYTTHFLDALDAVDFWKGFDCNKGESQDGSPNTEKGQGDNQ